MRFQFNFRIELFIIILIALSSARVSTMGSPIEGENILVIDGYGKPVYLPNIEKWDLVILQNAPDTIIENQIYDDGSTILVISSDNLVVRNNIIRNAKSYALFVEFCNNVQIYNNSIESGSHDGLISYKNQNVIINNNRVSAVVKNGIFAVGTNLTISNNQINNVAGTGIFIQDSSDLVVQNNSINNVDWTPIASDQASFDSGLFFENTYNGMELTIEDIDPSITNSISSIESSPSSTANNTENSSNNETHSPLTFMMIGIVFYFFIKTKHKISKVKYKEI